MFQLQISQVLHKISLQFVAPSGCPDLVTNWCHNVDLISSHWKWCVENKVCGIKKFNWLGPKKFLNFLSAPNLVPDTSHLHCEDKFYQQVNGCVMTSTTTSTIAQSVTGHVEETTTWSPNPNSFINFKRYVDGCLRIDPTNWIRHIFDTFNNFHYNLQFTIEKETGKLNFLDLTFVWIITKPFHLRFERSLCPASVWCESRWRRNF